MLRMKLLLESLVFAVSGERFKIPLLRDSCLKPSHICKISRNLTIVQIIKINFMSEHSRLKWKEWTLLDLDTCLELSYKYKIKSVL